MNIAITIDLEHDCPPFLTSYRGVTDGMPRLLDVLGREQVPATFFCTGDVARRYPAIVRRLVDEGHELGSHGDTHARFSTLSPAAAEREIADAAATLRAFAVVRSFRAPNLDFPDGYLQLLNKHGFTLDSSQGRHKQGSYFVSPSWRAGVSRVPATISPFPVRWPAPLRNLLFSRFRDPVVLFFHPWEFVDMTQTAIPRDCKWRTGEPALASLRDTIAWFRRRGDSFKRMSELPEATNRAHAA
jgi:peptidoglycan/xylan/chitin deacetylase (PgdA/CDA1 family)